MTPEEYAKSIGEAVSNLDRVRVEELCDQLVASLPVRDTAFDVKPAREILSSLRRKRHFGLICKVANAMWFSGQTDAQIRRQYGQALIELKQLYAARAIFLEIVNDSKSTRQERAEALGLLGRLHKESYLTFVDAPDAKKQQMLQESLSWYKQVYDWDRSKYLWHGINVVALLARADQDGIALPEEENFVDIAKDIRNIIAERDQSGDATLWDYATAMEAAVALYDDQSAAKWAERYVEKRPDAFEIASTLRQLEQVWNVKPRDDMGEEIVPLLKAALLATEDGFLSFSAPDWTGLSRTANAPSLERVFGEDSYKLIKWLQLGLECCQVIGLIARRDGSGVGTGFAVNGRSLSSRLDDAWYFLTNSHVITNDEDVIANSPPNQRPLKPQDAVVTFELLFEREPCEFHVQELVWTSPPRDLDATLLRLDRPFCDRYAKTYPIAKELPDPQEKVRVYIAGHPGGRRLAVSLHDNHLLEHNERLMQYRTPTDPGSSGSPVFNDQWELIGLHHAGSFKKTSLSDPARQHEANEGIRIGAIMAAI
jgi:S1-C subfamily serine protease